MSKVIVTTDTLGNVIGISTKNPEYGYIRVEQQAKQISEGGWFKFVKRSALIKGKVEDLRAADFKAGEEIPGKIVIRESFEPVNPANTDQGLKIAGDTGVICRVEDQPIYRDAYYTTQMEAEDCFIAHTNTDEIREVQAASRSLANLVAARPQEATL